jgi:DNA-binding response OmpR family regulator
MSQILLLEDDKLLAQSVIEELEEEGISVDWADDASRAADLSFDQKYDLYLFDVNLPDVNGFDFLRDLRESGDTTPTIFLTSKQRLEDVKSGFDAGAVDYIKKPFEMEELLIRISSKLPKQSLTTITKTLSIDEKMNQIICQGTPIELAHKEYEIARFLILNSSRVVSKEDIITEFYSDEPISDSTLRVYFNKIKNACSECLELENIRGVGYRIRFK